MSVGPDLSYVDRYRKNEGVTSAGVTVLRVLTGDLLIAGRGAFG